MARQLGVSDKTLYCWVHAEAEAEVESTQSDKKITEHSGKIAELERELKLLRQRCAKLRLAAAYLAEEGQV